MGAYFQRYAQRNAVLLAPDHRAVSARDRIRLRHKLSEKLHNSQAGNAIGSPLVGPDRGVPFAAIRAIAVRTIDPVRQRQPFTRS